MDPETKLPVPMTWDGDGEGAGGSGSGNGTATAATAKRTRVLLSCGPCRASKLKCDRSEPCGQCLKKARPDGCVYAPKPEKQKPVKGMAARLKRLEGMVRTMMDEGVAVPPDAAAAVPREEDVAQPGGHFFQGQGSTTYVGATHFMAILDDIEDMKSYFEEPDVSAEWDGESPGPSDDFEAPSLLLSSKNMPRNREDLFRLLPERQIADRLVMRYFSSQSPSQHLIHRPTFVKQYARFWTNPLEVSLHWLALLFMVMSLAVYYSTFFAPQELSGDSSMPPMNRFRMYRTAASWCLVWGKFTQPSIATIPPFIFYVEAEFLISRGAQMNCYVLSSVCLRLLVKMGLHRDPSKLANISAYEGEMRRRMWNMAVQLDLIVSFHMGLPSMINGIDSDCELPRNLMDEEFGEDSVELPPARPMTDYTEMTYPIVKSSLMRVFGQIAREAHLLTPAPYSEVMRLDRQLNETWRKLPQFLEVQPLEQCVTTPPMRIFQRYGLASLYNKSRCVLHRRFLLEPIPKKEHDYSRWQCLQGALTILEFQNTICHACQPGNMLSQHGWFVSSLAVHDFLLAAIIVYLAIGNAPFWDEGEHEWMDNFTPRLTKERLLHLLQKSYAIWVRLAGQESEVKKTVDMLQTMLTKLGSPGSSPPKMDETGAPASVQRSEETLETMSSYDSQLFTGLSISDAPSSLPSSVTNHIQSLGFGDSGVRSSDSGFDREWIAVGDEMDWRYFDNIMSQRHNDPTGGYDAGQTAWFDRGPALEDFDFSAVGTWDPNPDQQG